MWIQTGSLNRRDQSRRHMAPPSFALPSVLWCFFHSISHSLRSLYTCLQTLTVVNSAKLSCSSEKTSPDSRVLTVVVVCLILLNIQVSGDEMKPGQSLGFCKQKYCVFGLIVCLLPQWDLCGLGNDSNSNSTFSYVLGKCCQRTEEESAISGFTDFIKTNLLYS